MEINPNSFTERLLMDAGIVPGMRILDVGCGNGEVTLLVAKIVGETGNVVGIDQHESALTSARERAHKMALTNVTFQVGDLTNDPLDLQFFDAIVGRRVLMYLPDPDATIRRLMPNLRPGGIMVFQESDSTMIPGRVESWPLHEQVNQWIWQTVEREGANIHLGFHLPNVLTQAGLAVEHIRAEAIIQGQNTAYPLATIVRSVLPRMVEHAVVSEAEVNIGTLEQRLLTERENTKSVYISDMAFGVWGRKPH